MSSLKKFSGIFLICILLFCLTSFSQYTEYKKDIIYNSISFKEVRFYVDHGDTTFVQGMLEKRTMIKGIPCMRNIGYYTNGKLKTFILAEDFELNSHIMPKWTRVSYSKEKTTIFFGRDTYYKGYCCNGNFKKWFSTGIFTTLYPNGNLRSFYPCKDIEIDKIPCKSSPFAGIELHTNGKLKTCTLSKKHIIEGKEYKKNTHLGFDENGKLTRADKYVFWWVKA